MGLSISKILSNRARNQGLEGTRRRASEIHENACFPAISVDFGPFLGYTEWT